MQPAPNLATPHASHDLLLVAAAVDRDADPSIRAAAADQAARCPECAELAADLRIQSDGLAALPASRPVPRDMRLSADDAARLRRGAMWRRLLRPFGAEGLPGLRPLAATLTTLGIAGILLTAIPFALPGAASLPQLDTIGRAVNGAPVPAASSAGSEAQVPGAKGSTALPMASPSPSGAASYGGLDGSPQASASNHQSFVAPSSGPRLPPLAWVSLGLIVAGLGLFSVLFVARRAA